MVYPTRDFGELLKLVKKMLPKDNELPATTYEAKQLVCPLGLEVQKIHACPNDCILYRGEYENLDACPVCKRYLNHFILLYKNIIAIRILLLYICTVQLYFMCYIYYFIYFSLNYSTNFIYFMKLHSH